MASTGYVERKAQVGDLSLHYQEWGTPGAPAVVMLHGFALSGHMFDEFAARMQDRFHLLALDQRGHGDSDWSEDGEYTRDAFVSDVLGFADALGLDKFVLMGHSMGGMNAAQFAADHGDRLRSLVLIDVGPEAAREGVESIMQFTRMPDEVDFDEYVKRTHQFNPRRTEENIRERLGFRLKPTDSGMWTWKFDKRFRDPESGVRVGSEMSPDAMWDLFRRIQVPTLLVRGAESDILTAEIAERTVTEMPKAYLVTIPDAGHSVPGDNPDAFTDAVAAFLDVSPAPDPEAALDLPLEDAVDSQYSSARRPGLLVYVAAGAGLAIALTAAGLVLKRRRRAAQEPPSLRGRARQAVQHVPRSRDDLAQAEQLAGELSHTLARLARQSADRARVAARETDRESAERAAREALDALQLHVRDASRLGRKIADRRQPRRRWIPGRRRRSFTDRAIDAAFGASEWVARSAPEAGRGIKSRWAR